MTVDICTTNYAFVLISICMGIQTPPPHFTMYFVCCRLHAFFFLDNLTDSMHNYTNLKIFLWSGSGDGPDEPTKPSTTVVTTTTVVPFYSVNSIGSANVVDTV